MDGSRPVKDGSPDRSHLAPRQDVDALDLVPPRLPKPRGGEASQRGALAARQRRGHPFALLGQGGMADRVDTVVQAVQISASNPP
jgi:hypothetical protein